jgi:hypothetical protein
MNFLASGYNALLGETGQTQSPHETIDRLSARLQTALLLEDRRAAVLGLKGLARDWKLVKIIKITFKSEKRVFIFV